MHSNGQLPTSSPFDLAYLFPETMKEFISNILCAFIMDTIAVKGALNEIKTLQKERKNMIYFCQLNSFINVEKNIQRNLRNLYIRL